MNLRTILIIICVIFIVGFIGYEVYKYFKRKQLLANKVKDLQQQLNTLNTSLAASQSKYDAVNKAIQDLSAVADKQLFDLKQAKKKEYAAQLQNELNQLRAAFDIDNQKRNIEHIRQSLLIAQQQLANVSSEDFAESHSISLEDDDKADIEILTATVKKLKHKEILKKLIWTTYYQSLIKQLTNRLQANKECGIYKITNIDTQKSYIGQSVDIGDRWVQHCKAGLGINNLSYLTNKFYKALNKNGIENFTFEIIELCPRQQLDERQKYWISFFKSNEDNFGYNSTSGNR